jgi:hypothetical protein
MSEVSKNDDVEHMSRPFKTQLSEEKSAGHVIGSGGGLKRKSFDRPHCQRIWWCWAGWVDLQQMPVREQIFQHFQVRHPSTRLHSDGDYIIACNGPRCNIVSNEVTFAHRIEE